MCSNQGGKQASEVILIGQIFLLWLNGIKFPSLSNVIRSNDLNRALLGEEDNEASLTGQANLANQ